MSEVGRTVYAVMPAKDMLDFEEQWPRWSGAKDEAIRARFGVTPARYFQLLLRTIDTAEAEAARPMLVHRLRRVRDRNALETLRRAG